MKRNHGFSWRHLEGVAQLACSNAEPAQDPKVRPSVEFVCSNPPPPPQGLFRGRPQNRELFATLKTLQLLQALQLFKTYLIIGILLGVVNSSHGHRTNPGCRLQKRLHIGEYVNFINSDVSGNHKSSCIGKLEEQCHINYRHYYSDWNPEYRQSYSKRFLQGKDWHWSCCWNRNWLCFRRCGDCRSGLLPPPSEVQETQQAATTLSVRAACWTLS